MARNNQQRTHRARLSVPRILTPVALAITLAACSSKPPAPESADINMPATQSVQAYLIKADSSQGSLQNDWLILALKAAIAAGDSNQASLIIERLAKQPLNNEQQANWQLLRAENYLLLSRPDLVAQQLYFQPWWQLPDTVWLSYHNLRAQALEQTGDYYRASQELSWLYALSDDTIKPEIANRLWEGLGQYSVLDLQRFAQESNTWEMNGWLQLALYMETQRGNMAKLKTQLQNWLTANPEHPANLHTPQSIQEILALEIVEPKSTALLLPLSGKFAKPAQLVRDGFLMAMMDDMQRDEAAILTVIDTNATAQEEMLSRFQENSVDFIVGPLVKSEIEAVQQLQAEQALNIPMLALNIPQDVESNTDNCYLTLSPEQEVEQAAQYLNEQGYRYPLVLAPTGSNGDRAVAAFKAEWKKLQRSDVAVASFANKAKLQQSIETIFGLKSSESRIVQMDKLLGLEMENQPRSRRDIDAVYIVAGSAELTLIKPFIEVAINPEATPPKLFANSISNSGKRQFEDLSGVMYSDIPLLITQPQPVSAQIESLWPGKSNGEKRLLALGMDAYKMVNELPKMKITPDYQVQGQTGLLSLGEQCTIKRQLNWAEYEALQ